MLQFSEAGDLYHFIYLLKMVFFDMGNTDIIPKNDFYQFKIKALASDEVIDFQKFKGKKVLLVNVASKCAFTNQYEELEEMYQKHSDKLVVIGFPCNQFLFQESGSEEQIAKFLSLTYNVSFPITEKIKVKGIYAHPIYKWLTDGTLNGKGDFRVSWNFNKFLIDENGYIEQYHPSKVIPSEIVF